MISDDELIEKVRTLMFDNIKAGLSPYLKHHYCYVMPSPGNYPFQWWWDTCFNVFILCALDEIALAKQNLISLFRMQKESGFVGHMIFWESLLPRETSLIFYRDRRCGWHNKHYCFFKIVMEAFKDNGSI